MAEKQQVLDLAHELGFALVGVAKAQYGSLARERYLDWCKSDFCADMSYLRDRRDVTHGLESVLPGVQSAIMLGMPYKHARKSEGDAPVGRVSLFATGRDYHRSFESRQKKLIILLKEFGDTPKAFVDYGPVLERHLAVEAGLGFIGKNGCLIHPVYGSYIFLGVILSTLDFPCDAPVSGDCGDCMRCLSACPTKALHAPYTVDARRCISYHTIENKEEIPPELRPKMGRWILGCDMCQLSCPFNRDTPDIDTPDFQGQRLAERTGLYSFLEMTEPEFRERFSGNTAMRPGRDALARNAAIALGNTGDTTQLPRIQRLLHTEQSALVREALAWAFAQLETRS